MPSSAPGPTRVTERAAERPLGVRGGTAEGRRGGAGSGGTRQPPRSAPGGGAARWGELQAARGQRTPLVSPSAGEARRGGVSGWGSRTHCRARGSAWPCCRRGAAGSCPSAPQLRIQNRGSPLEHGHCLRPALRRPEAGGSSGLYGNAAGLCQRLRLKCPFV